MTVTDSRFKTRQSINM